MRRYPGVVIGIVKEIDTQGRLQLEFPWLAQSYRSAWAPVATPLAGKQRGQFFMPEIDDEVLVAFEHGDFDHPFVVGFLWNGVDTPPETTNKNRVIKTPGGHELRFEDQDNAQKIMIKSSSGHQIVLDDAPTAQSITVKTKLGQSLVLDDNKQLAELKGGERTPTLHAGMVQIA